MTRSLLLKACKATVLMRRGYPLVVASWGAQKQKGQVSGRSLNSEEESRRAIIFSGRQWDPKSQQVNLISLLLLETRASA
jgi:hypothetical protein